MFDSFSDKLALAASFNAVMASNLHFPNVVKEGEVHMISR